MSNFEDSPDRLVDTAEDDITLTEGDLDEVSGGINFTKIEYADKTSPL